MKDIKEICKDAINDNMNDTYTNIIEISAFVAIRDIAIQFANKRIDQQTATILKNKVFKAYEDNKKEYEFKEQVYDTYLAKINKTEDLRSKLRHQLKENNTSCLDTALKLIEIYSGEEWKI